MTTFYAGFDTDICPPDKPWGSLAKAFRFCGYYLVAPSHQNASWRGQRARILSYGVSPVALFVGQELGGPGSHLVNAAEGQADGQLAVQRMIADGFPSKSTVYLDLEIPELPANMIAYLQRWCHFVAQGGFRAGVYCNHHIAAQARALTMGARIWAAKVPTLVGSTEVAPYAAPDPAGSGDAEAVIWQFRANVILPDIGGLFVDRDSSTMADPGAPPLQLAA